MRIYTRTGDDGETGLFGGGRVSKAHRRVMAYGEVDELNAVIGVVRATEPADDSAVLADIQRDLFAIGALLASPQPHKVQPSLTKAQITSERVTELEHLIDEADRELQPLKAFILPGGTPKAAQFHLARTVCRRAERAAVALAIHEQVPEILVVYLNRLSDLLFALSRRANARAGHPETTW